MRILMILTAFVACALSAQGTVDPDVDQIGLYFDLDANVVCLEAPAYEQLYAYVIITNPSSEVWGYDLCWCADGPAVQTGVQPYGGTLQSWSQGCFDCWYGAGTEPYPFVGTNVPLVRLSYFITGESAVQFYMKNSVGPEGAPPVYYDADGSIDLGISSGDAGLPVAVLNGDCGTVVSTDEVTFDSVKSLYR